MAVGTRVRKGLAALAARMPVVSRTRSAAKSSRSSGSTTVASPVRGSGRTSSAKKAAGSTKSTKSAKSAKSAKAASKAGAPAGARTRIDTTPGKAGGSRYVRRDSAGHFTKDQVSVGKSLAADSRTKAKTKASKGNKDRGD